MDITMEALKELLSAQTEDAVKRALDSLPPVKATGTIEPEREPDARTPEAREADAFKSFLHRGSPSGLRREAVKATMNEGTGSNGGYIVPAQYSTDIVTPLANLSFLRRMGARVLTITGTDAFHVPRLIYSAAATLTAENAAYTQSEPTFAEALFTPYKFTKLSKASEEVVADAEFNLWANILQPDYVQAFAAAENTYFTTGTGTSQPEGVLTNTPAGVTAASTSTFTADELLSTFFALDYKYRDNAVWMMRDDAFAITRKLKDSQNRYLIDITNGLGDGPVITLMGKPVFVNNSMPALATGVPAVWFGDPSYYWIADFGDMYMQRLDELYAANGQVGFRAYKRFDGHLMLTAAATSLVLA